MSNRRNESPTINDILEAAIMDEALSVRSVGQAADMAEWVMARIAEAYRAGYSKAADKIFSAMDERINNENSN